MFSGQQRKVLFHTINYNRGWASAIRNRGSWQPLHRLSSLRLNWRQEYRGYTSRTLSPGDDRSHTAANLVVRSQCSNRQALEIRMRIFSRPSFGEDFVPHAAFGALVASGRDSG